MKKISTKTIGAAGEYYVLSQLLRRGWVAALAPEGVPNMDILVTNEHSNKLCAIQVKTCRVKKTHRGMGWPMQSKHETSLPNLFYIFVDIGEGLSDPTVSYILPSDKVAICIQEGHRLWLNSPGRGGRSRKDSKMRKLHLDHSTVITANTQEERQFVDQYGKGWLEPYRENWSILGLPEESSF